MSNIVEVKNITKKFGNNEVLKGISFNLKKGEVIGLLGGNGAGKTTLAEIFAGVSKPTSGEIKYNFSYKDSFKEKMGMQFQDSTYPSGLTVKDLIVFARNLRKIKMSQRKLKEILNIFQMGNFYKEKVKSLSGGQRQKINVLLSVLHNPEVVVLDEITTGLDIAAREEIIKFTKELLKANEMSAILVSHHIHEIEALADRVIVLSKGKIIEEETVKGMKRKHGSIEKYMIEIIDKENRSVKNTKKKQNNFSFSNVLSSKATKEMKLRKSKIKSPFKKKGGTK